MTQPQRISRGAALLVGGALAALAATPALAAGDLSRISITAEPAAVRVTLHLRAPLPGELAVGTMATDARPGDGRALLRVPLSRAAAAIAPTRSGGVQARVVRAGSGAMVVRIGAPVDAFKGISYREGTGGRQLHIRLWRATTDRGAAIRDDGCLRLVAARGGARPAVRGLELRPVFEHNVVVSLRAPDVGERRVVAHPFTTGGFRFLPDMSGYSRPGRFAGPVPATVTARRTVMLEAAVESAKDGALECLVQTPVVLTP